MGFAGLLGLMFSPLSHARVIQHTDAFLEELSQGCARTRTTHYLTDEQKARLPEGTASVIVRHRIGCGDRFVYFDSHRVRSQAETLAIVIDAQGRVEQVRVLSFDEPEEYLPKNKWFGAFGSKRLSPRLVLQAEIPMITGATLSARAATDSVRRILSLHAELGAGVRR
jgi:hypothetical protein